MFFQQNAGNIAASAAQICKTLRDTLYQAQGFQNWLEAQTDAELTGIGFQQADVTVLRAAFSDLAALGAIAYGQAAPSSYNITGTYDFSQNVKEISGVV